MTMDEQLLRVPEVARRLGLDGGTAYVRESALEDYQRRHPAATA